MQPGEQISKGCARAQSPAQGPMACAAHRAADVATEGAGRDRWVRSGSTSARVSWRYSWTRDGERIRVKHRASSSFIFSISIQIVAIARPSYASMHDGPILSKTELELAAVSLIAA